MRKKRVPKKRRGPRGEGSVFPDARRGGYRGKVPVGRYPDGRTKYVEVWGRTQAECVAAKKLVLPPGPDTTVAQWADRWLAESGAQAQTKHDYALTVAKHVKPALGHRKVRDLTAQDVENAVRGWTSLGPNTAKKNLRQVVTMLEAARRAKLVAENVAKDARGPKARKVTVNVFSPRELSLIVTTAAESPLWHVFAPLAAVGCRVGEAMALDVADFDPTARTLSITKTYSRRHGVRRPKSENGIRTVRVPAAAMPAIRAAIGTRTTGPLFLARHGRGRREHNAILLSWKKLLARLGLAYRCPHTLRHTCASLLIANGAPIADVAKFLGDSVAVVVRTYCHSVGADVTAVMEGVFSGAQGCGKVAEKPSGEVKRLQNKARGEAR